MISQLIFYYFRLFISIKILAIPNFFIKLPVFMMYSCFQSFFAERNRKISFYSFSGFRYLDFQKGLAYFLCQKCLSELSLIEINNFKWCLFFEEYHLFLMGFFTVLFNMPKIEENACNLIFTLVILYDENLSKEYHLENYLLLIRCRPLVIINFKPSFIYLII